MTLEWENAVSKLDIALHQWRVATYKNEILLKVYHNDIMFIDAMWWIRPDMRLEIDEILNSNNDVRV